MEGEENMMSVCQLRGKLDLYLKPVDSQVLGSSHMELPYNSEYEPTGGLQSECIFRVGLCSGGGADL